VNATAAPAGSWLSRVVVGVVAVSIMLTSATAAPAPRVAPPQAATHLFTGLGSWIDIYDTRLLSDPAGVVSVARRHRVTTLYVETSNSDQPAAIVHAAAIRRLVALAHHAGILVVGWYLPTLADPTRDVARLVAAAAWRSGRDRFDGIGVDIESSVVANPTTRNTRLAALLFRLRRLAAVPIGAIVPAPPGLALHPRFWPRFPWRLIAQRTDAILPMCYWTYHVDTSREAAAYTQACIDGVRRSTGDSTGVVHLIGGITGQVSANGTLQRDATPGQVAAFASVARAANLTGISLYDLAATTSSDWSELRRYGYGVP
jgi:hypothetical protein